MQSDVAPTLENLCKVFLLDPLINSIVDSTNAYAKKILPAEKFSAVTHNDILRFLDCPDKRNYWWTGNAFWPACPVCQSLTQDCFLCIWQCIHCIKQETIDEENDTILTRNPVKRRLTTATTTTTMT